MGEIDRLVPLEIRVEIFKEILGKAEELRTSVGGEVRAKPKHEGYANVVEIAANVFEQSSALIHKLDFDHPQREGVLLAMAGSVLMIATTYESMAKHTINDPQMKENVLGEALNWLKKLDDFEQELDSIDHTLHGPILWTAEIYRNRARIFERHPTDKNENLYKALEYYRKAIEVGERKTNEAKKIDNKILLNGSLSVTGVAMGELARVGDTLLHEFGEFFEEEDIRKLYVNGRNLVWQTRDIPNYDRLDTVEARVFEYLITHNIQETDPDYKETMDHWKTLFQESDLVRKNMKSRLEQGLIPERFTSWFQETN